MSFRVRASAALVIGLAAFAAAPAHAEAAQGFYLGPEFSYASGIKDVTDLYHDNYSAATGNVIKTHLLIPVGIGFASNYQWDSGLRADLNLGPLFLLLNTNTDTGSADLYHFELPVVATVGYTFFPSARVAPYVRAGFAYHLANGTYDHGAEPGLYAAAGVEFARRKSMRYVLEVALDKSKIEFDSYACTASCPARVKLNTYDTLVSLGVKF